MKILMFGPARGHNVKRFFDYFQRSEEHHLYYFYFTRKAHYELSNYDAITWIPYYRPLLLLKILRKELDLLWIHNWTPIPVLFFILFFKRKKVPINFNVWSEPIPLLARSKSWKGAFYRWFFRKCRTVQCTWYGTYRLVEDIEGVRPVLLRWGMEEEWFQEGDSAILKEESRRFLNSLPEKKTRFFFPKSINRYNRHDLVLEAVEQLKADGIDNFVVFFWLGNHNQPDLLKMYKNWIRDKGLEDLVQVVEHDFLPAHDLKMIWEAMDSGLQIVDRDQFSTSIQEPMLLKKELVVSDIPPYRIFEESYGVTLDLVENQAVSVQKRMEKVIKGERTSEEELERRRQIFLKDYRFEKNMAYILNKLREGNLHS